MGVLETPIELRVSWHRGGDAVEAAAVCVMSLVDFPNLERGRMGAEQQPALNSVGAISSDMYL